MLPAHYAHDGVDAQNDEDDEEDVDNVVVVDLDEGVGPGQIVQVGCGHVSREAGVAGGALDDADGLGAGHVVMPADEQAGDFARDELGCVVRVLPVGGQEEVQVVGDRVGLLVFHLRGVGLELHVGLNGGEGGVVLPAHLLIHLVVAECGHDVAGVEADSGGLGH